MNGRSLSSIIGNVDVLAHLTAQAARLMRLQTAFEGFVPVALSHSARVANIKSGKVVILAENGACALKLKQLATTLQLRFSSICPEVTEIEIRVQVGAAATKAAIFKVSEPKLSAAAQAGLSEETAAGIAQLAEKLPGKSPLKASLEQLLSRTTRRRGSE
ncbi:MAG: hypothetical protein RIR70_1619 [Pseudomonadota bacterium]|jgi:hypothetical protein